MDTNVRLFSLIDLLNTNAPDHIAYKLVIDHGVYKLIKLIDSEEHTIITIDSNNLHIDIDYYDYIYDVFDTYRRLFIPREQKKLVYINQKYSIDFIIEYQTIYDWVALKLSQNIDHLSREYIIEYFTEHYDYHSDYKLRINNASIKHI